MIQSQSFQTALPFAAKLSSLGLVAAARPNTLLQELVRLSVPSSEVVVRDPEGLGMFGTHIQATTQGTIEDPTQHSLELDGGVEDLAKCVTSHVSYARNSVKPLVMQFADALRQYRENNVLKSASDKFNLVTLNIPAILEDESFLDTLSYYKDRKPLAPDMNPDLDSTKSREDLISIMSIGHDRTDKLLMEWISELDESFITNIWVSLFTKATAAPGGRVYAYYEIEGMNAFEKANAALVIYLIARKLYEVVPENAQMNLNTYKNIMAQFRDYGGALLLDALKKIALFVKAKTLIVEANPVTYTAKLNGVVYRDWLKTGGSPEVILGILVAGAQVATVSLIDEKAAEYKSRWNSFVTFFNASESNKTFQYFKDFVVTEFYQQMKHVDEIEADYIAKNPSYMETVKKLVDEEMMNLKTSSMDDLYELALCLVGKCRFYYTSAYNILHDINEAGKVNPNVDVREAALIAVINYVADYLADQIALSNG